MSLTDEQRQMARRLRNALAGVDDESLDAFLSGYALGRIAGLLVDAMTPAQRLGFIASQRVAHPEAFSQGQG